MAIRPYLAMTPTEIADDPQISRNQAWMACHFSPRGNGLIHVPHSPRPGMLLILNDQLPIHGHDPELIANQLADCMESFDCPGLLLDFQRPDSNETSALIRYLLRTLPCPVVTSDLYARELDCPVFLSPVPPSTLLRTHLAPWKGREVWLDIGLDGEQVTLTEQGAAFTPLPRFAPPDTGLRDEKLHCHYKTEVGENARFTLWRTEDDLSGLMEEAEAMGVKGFVGLYQELHGFAPPQRQSSASRK